ncbi:hypothetical protein CONPUDRAFT_75330 [Coniophora puteana RWD-64-598 SS2]|uniref:Uncharacterized protein n=1 Tax=Coniophora puteana (strain RWD-64-598) TaxID=741705 RepID=A0A5M3MHQ0_CONPW|nr:uncharacterized protein CONPUDRAFT_75330 [Coniophora puteana RWD-64-598 SS2]EIW78722.1 hypothetical protein CONPUDRAFT_75330 [Coniophora puteana RWD-64-598 SS2]
MSSTLLFQPNDILLPLLLMNTTANQPITLSGQVQHNLGNISGQLWQYAGAIPCIQHPINGIDVLSKQRCICASAIGDADAPQETIISCLQMQPASVIAEQDTLKNK